MKRKILVLFGLILLISISCVSATEDMDQTVNEDVISISQDDMDIISSDDGTYTALQEKINNAPENSTITLENDYVLERSIYIDKSITIDGNGHTLDANNKDRIFFIQGSDVELNNLSFVNGKIIDGYGGAIEAVYMNTLKINNCVFKDNHVSNTGSEGSFVRGGAISCGDLLIIKNSVFESNSVEGKINGDEIGEGGAIRCYKGTVENCTFINNSANLCAGAVTGFNLTIVDSIFEDNYAMYGSAIDGFRAEGSVVVTKCIFKDNREYDAAFFGVCMNTTNSVLVNYNYNSTTSWYGNTAENYLQEPFNDLKNWLFLNATASPSEIYYSNQSTVSFAFDLYDNSTNQIQSFDNSELPKFYFNLSAINGTIDKENVLPGEKVIFTPTQTATEGIVTATYGDVSFSILIHVMPLINLDVSNVTKTYGGDEKLEITLTVNDIPIADAAINVLVNGENYSITTDSNGKASMDIDLDYGNYTAEVTYGNISTFAEIIVNRINTNTSLNLINNSRDSRTLIADVSPSNVSGRVMFVVNGKSYVVNVSDSKASIDLNNLVPDKYTAKATTYFDDVNYNSSSSNQIDFEIKKYYISAPDVTKYFGDDKRFVVNLTDVSGNPLANESITITVNGVKYNRITKADGTASIGLNLNCGTHDIITEYDVEKVTSKVNILTTVDGSDVTKIFRNGTNYTPVFFGKDGKKLSFCENKVELNINGVYYYRSVKEDGSISFALNLEQGTYTITAKNPVTGENIANNVTILPRIINNNNLTKYYRNDSQFTFTLLGDDGKPIAGEKASININSVFYYRTTDKNGNAMFKINLGPGTYVLTVEYKGCKVSNTVEVLNVIKTSNVKMKYHDGTRFKVTVLDGQGKPYANQNVTLNINGMFYPRVTNDDGTASLAINLMAGEYIITSTYNGLNAANKVTISS